MTTFDILIVLFILALAARGFRNGAVIGVSSLFGFVGGVWVGTQLAARLLEGGSESPYAPLLAFSVAISVGMVVGHLALALAYRFRTRFTGHIVRRVDGAAGALLLGAFGMAIVWVGAAAIMQSRAGGDLRDGVRRSAVVRELNALLPPSGPLLNALARIDPLREIKGPSANVPPPDPGIATDPDVRAAAGASVRVLGTACGYGVEGSGWVAASGLVVTNAHVVSGQTDTTVQPGGEGPVYAATAVWFDPRNDLAVLAAPAMRAAPLRLDPTTQKGLPVAIVGYPRNGPLDIRAGRMGATQHAISDDIYGNGPITRRMASFRGLVRNGNSGGPLVDEHGVVRATVFASQSGSDNRRGYGVPGSVIRDALNQVDRATPVSTGACS